MPASQDRERQGQLRLSHGVLTSVVGADCELELQSHESGAAFGATFYGDFVPSSGTQHIADELSISFI